MTMCPMRLNFTLRNMPCEAGWSSQRPLVLWITDASRLSYAKVRAVEVHHQAKALNISIEAFTWSHETVSRCVEGHCRHIGDATFVDICVRLSKPTALANPVYESISRMESYRNLSTDSAAGAVVDAVYGRTPLSCDNSDDQPRFTPWTGEHVYNIKGRAVTLTHDQRDAVALGVRELSVVAIQAAFGTCKTVVGSLIAAHLAIERRIPVIVTATTNAAVAQFTETILSLDDYPDLVVVRYVSGTALAENLTRTPVDLNEILKYLGDNFADKLEEKDKQLCQDFKEGLEHLEEYLHHPEQALAMTEDDKEEYFISESFVSENLQKMVDLMFALLKPSVICATTASLLNTTAAPEGIFARHVSNFQVLIGDDTSQIPEPALVAMAARLPRVRHVYIGDVHQLEPHAKCSRSSNPARFGAHSVMSVLCEAHAVPVAPLITTFRTHPALIELPNRVACSRERPESRAATDAIESHQVPLAHDTLHVHLCAWIFRPRCQ
ncbi:hypothetical protein ANCDUO_13037 [Ancylostoma duodenale]|uniref:DNA2/NAM7 helicase helicase domain-containing protein n=1 Tax=Ancylostoma duodenale TaxID=51022 RepID=A0A0C2CJZ9_9BILA|nr:hypothetical protein ANCDUO_13037 [Ancylostoma duodenale]